MPVRIALDAMGGDFGCRPSVEAAKLLRDHLDVHVILVGNEEVLRAELGADVDIPIVASGSVVDMDEAASTALKKKPDSSIMIATQLLKQGAADAVVSAGNSGATMACAGYALGRLKGVHRPAITTVLPTGDHPIIVLDVGANVDCKPELFVDFAIMGSVYAEQVLGRSEPRVGLLSIGTEAGKGNEQTQAAYPLLVGAPVNFAGNMEGRQIFGGEFDVVVCDGFVGNIILKFGEATAENIRDMLKDQVKQVITQHPESGGVLQETFTRLFKGMDVEEFGGAPLLGVNGTCLISHGSSSARAIANAAINAAKTFSHQVNERITKRLLEIHSPEAV